MKKILNKLNSLINDIEDEIMKNGDARLISGAGSTSLSEIQGNLSAELDILQEHIDPPNAA